MDLYPICKISQSTPMSYLTTSLLLYTNWDTKHRAVIVSNSSSIRYILVSNFCPQTVLNDIWALYRSNSIALLITLVKIAGPNTGR